MMFKNQNSEKALAFNALVDLAQNGIDILECNPTDEQIRQWMSFSQKAVEFSTKNFAPSIQMYYLKLLLDLHKEREKTLQDKMLRCLDYLLGVAQEISESK
jgi:hypothetical protein